MKEEIAQAYTDILRVAEQLQGVHVANFTESVAKELAEAFNRGNKLIVAGNGGSLCDAMHIAEEFTGFFRASRSPLPAMALADPGHMSCVSNDLSFDEVFARGVEAFGQPGDLLFVLTTSGNSPNIVRAVEVAQAKEMVTVAFLGKGGGRLAGRADFELCIQDVTTSDRIQEAHMAVAHVLIEMTEQLLFAPKESCVGRT